MDITDLADNILKFICNQGYKANEIWEVKYWQIEWNKILENACENGNSEFVRFIYDFICVKNLIIIDVHLKIHMCIIACINNKINILKYLNEEVGFEKRFFQYCVLDVCRMKSKCECVDCFKYMFEVIGFNVEDFQSCWNNICENACVNGHFEVAKYMLSIFVTGLKNFRYGCHECCKWICNANVIASKNKDNETGHEYFKLVVFLVEKIGIKANHFENCIFDGEVTYYLHDAFKDWETYLYDAEENLFYLVRKKQLLEKFK